MTTTTDAPNISILCKELGTIKGKWFMIGIHSGVPYEKLEEFKNAEYPLAAVFNYCLKGNIDEPLTWRSIVNTLKSEDVNECGLAETIKAKYCMEEEIPKPMEKENLAQDVPPTSPKSKGMSPYSGCYLFVNDSQLWIEGQKVSAKHLKDTQIDSRFRIDLDKFVNLLAKGRNILGAYLYGSKPPPNDTVWKAAREKNFEVNLFQRSGTGQEKALNIAMATQITKTIYTLDAQEKDEVVFITVTGDRNLKPPIDDALDNQIRVELWSWQDSMSREFRQLANTNPLFTANALDRQAKAFTYTSYMSSRYRDINPAKAIVYRDVPKSKRFLYEFADYLHQLMRVFYITPVASHKEGMQDLIVEFPKTKPDIVVQKLETLKNFPYKPCSYPEYEQNSKISSHFTKTNRFEALGEFNEETPAETLTLEDEITITTSSPDIMPEKERKGKESQGDEADGGEEDSDWKSNLALLGQVRKRSDIPCKWGDHCARGSKCPYKHTEEEKHLFSTHPNIPFNYRKTRLCTKIDQHTTEQQMKNCIFAHTNEDSWCIKCAKYGHLTDDCKYPYKHTEEENFLSARYPNEDDRGRDNGDWASPSTKFSTSLHNLSEVEEEEELIEKIVTAIESNKPIDRKHAHTMLTGPGESGKTSLLYRLLGKEKQLSTSTGVAEPVAIVDVNSVTVFSSNKWQEVEYEASLVRQMNEGAQVSQPLQANTESSSQEPTPYQAPDTANLQKEPSEPFSSAKHTSTTPITTESRQILENTVTKHKKFLKSKYSLYLRDAGGQVEFQEMVSLLVFGASFFIFVFNACLGLKNTFKVGYRKSTEIKLYSSSITTKEALIRTLATVYAMKTSGEVPVKTHNPYVLIVGTHKDELGEKAEEKIKELNEELKDLITSNGFEDLVQYADTEKDQVMFTVDNKADSDDDFKPIREKITNLVCGRKEFNFKYPIKNLMFYLELQTDERTVLTLEECRRMAEKYDIVGDEVLELLYFLHFRIGVIHFINIEGVRPVILKKPETLFNEVTDIVAKTFPRDAWTTKEHSDFEKKGILPKSAFESVIDSQDVFSCEEFIKILVHLHIIIPFTASESTEEEYYFIPCALSHAPEPPEDDEQESAVMPLAVTFQCNHCPKGLFGVLITHLMADKSTFTLNKERIYKDQISLTIQSTDAQDRVTLKSCSSHFEITFLPEKAENQENPVTVNNKICSWLRCKLEKLIKESIDNLNYDEEKVAPKMSLKCAHCSRLHPVETVKSTNCLVIRCNEIHKRIPVSNKEKCWFHQETCDTNPIEATNSSISAPVLEMPPSLPVSMIAAPVGQEPQKQHHASENRSVDTTKPSKDNMQPLNDNALEIDDLKDVLDEVEPLSSKWRLFCIKLGLNESTLDDIEQNNPRDVDVCLYKAMGEWLKLNYNYQRHGRPSWKKIVEAAKRLNNGLSEKIAAAKLQ